MHSGRSNFQAPRAGSSASRWRSRPDEGKAWRRLELPSAHPQSRWHELAPRVLDSLCRTIVCHAAFAPRFWRISRGRVIDTARRCRGRYLETLFGDNR